MQDKSMEQDSRNSKQKNEQGCFSQEAVNGWEVKTP